MSPAMERCESMLGRSRLESLAESAYDNDRRIAGLEETIAEQRREIEELKSESRIAAEFRIIMHERVARAEGH